MDTIPYRKYMKDRFDEYELLCRRCGACCGAGDDPCANLVSCGENKYDCRTYDKRLGLQMTISGKIFNCVPIKDNIKEGFSNPDCIYTGT